MRRLLAALIVLAMTGSSAAALGIASPSAAHGCCKVRVQAAHPCHTTTLSCCKPAPDPDRQSTVPPASGSLVAAPELLALHHAAAIPPDVVAAARAYALVAHAEARLKSPPDLIYLRNTVLLV
jgi:hypothetical protein